MKRGHDYSYLISAQLHIPGVYHLYGYLNRLLSLIMIPALYICALCCLHSLHCLNCNGVTYVYRMFDILRFLLCCLIFIFVACFISGLNLFANHSNWPQ